MSETLASTYLNSLRKRFLYYKDLGDKTFEQLAERDFHFTPNESANSIAIIVQHISGNMLSRFTDFLISDGEKSWRNRDIEFKQKFCSKEELIQLWEKGWQQFLSTLQSLTDDNLQSTVLIRNEAHTVIDALNRQLAHYPYHVGQIIYIGKQILGKDWKNLSIAKGESNLFNKSMGL